MANKNKRRGKYFEDVVANILCTKCNLTKSSCFRSPNSGNGAFEYGDIFFDTSCSIKECVFECKYHKSWNFTSFFPALSKGFLSWVDELLQAVEKYKHNNGTDPKHFGIVFSKPYSEIYLILLSKTEFDFNNGICDTHYAKLDSITINDTRYYCRFMIFKDFADYLAYTLGGTIVNV